MNKAIIFIIIFFIIFFIILYSTKDEFGSIGVYFLSFADTKYSATLQRIRNEAEDMNIFDDIFTYNENDLDTKFFDKHKEFINNNNKGYGFWIWKPQIVLQTISKIPEDSILLYSDAGSTLHKEYLSQLIELVEKCKKENFIGSYTNRPEYIWTKKEVIKAFNYKGNLNDNQILGTFFLIKNNGKMRDFLNEWAKWTERYDLLDNSITIDQNEGFIENRNEQSFLSLLSKKNNFYAIDGDNDLKFIEFTRKKY